MADDIPQGEGYALRKSPSLGSPLPRQSSKDFRRVNSDSGVGVSRRNGTWACSLCKYENVDPTKNRCALCGTQRQESQSKSISALAFSSYSSTMSKKASKVQKHNPSSTSSYQVERPVTPERGIDSGPTPAPGIQVERSGVDPPKSDAPTNGDKKSEKIGSITVPGNDVLRRADSTSSMEIAENSDKVSPLSSLKASVDYISIRLLDLVGHSSADLTSEHESQEFDHSAATLPCSSVAGIRHSDATINMSNVHHGTLKDIDMDSIGSPEHFDGASTSGDVSLNDVGVVPEVSLNELYAMGTVPDALTADLTEQHMKKPESPSNQSPPSVIQSQEGETKKGAWVPLVISISPDDHNKDLEANNFQIEDPPNNEVSVGEIEPQAPTSRTTSIVRAAFVALVLLVVVMSVTLSVVGSEDNGDGSVTVRTPSMTLTMSPAPSGAPTSQATMPPTKSPVDVSTAAPVPTAPFPVTASPSPLPTRLPTNRPTMAPTPAPTPSPTPQPTQIPTNRPTSPQTPGPTVQTAKPTIALTTEFVPVTDFVGLAANDRFGTTVSLGSEGNILAVSSLEGEDPIRVFVLENGSWNSFNTDPSNSSNAISGDYTIGIASAGGIPVIAVAYEAFFRVLEYVNGSWRSRGRLSIPWISADSVVEASVAVHAVQLSSNASVLAAASLNESGNAIVVRVFDYNATQQWELRGRAISRVRPVDATGRISSLSFSLSGDGQVVVIADRVMLTQISIEAFAWTGSDWTQRGSALTFSSSLSSFGPAVALSDDGGVMGVAVPSPDATRVYHWANDTWSQMGGNLASGSSIATTKSGLRMVIGNRLSSRATIQDFRDGAWVATSPLNGTIQSQFGSSVDVSSDGNTVVVGAPLDDGNGNNAGRVDIFA